MRIIAGSHKGSTLYLPKNKTTRPLKDIVRENIFNLLTHSTKIIFEFKNSNVLDLYAGTGSFGLECLSRQAKSVCFVEKEKDAYKILNKNIKKLKVEKKTKILFEDIFKLIKKHNIFNSKFEIIFCDPPYEDKNIKQLIKLIYNRNLLSKNGIIVLHRNKNTKEKFSSYSEIVDERIYGLSKVIFIKLLY